MRTSNRPVQALVWLTSLAMLVIVGAVAWLLWTLRAHVLSHAREEAMSLTRIHVEQTQRIYQHVDLVLQGVQERLETLTGQSLSFDHPAIHLLLRTRSMGADHLAAVALVDLQGRVVNSSRDMNLPAISVADREYFKAFASQNPPVPFFLDKPVRNRLNGIWSQQMSRPIRDPQGHLVAVIFASINLESYAQALRDMRFDMDRTISMYFDDGTLLASSGRRDNLLGMAAPELYHEAIPTSKAPVHLTHRTTEGRQAFALARVPDFPLLISVSNDQEMALAEWREFSMSIVLGAGLTMLFIATVAYLLMHQLRREENLSSELDLMSDRYRQTVDSAMDAIVAIDQQHQIVLFNPAAEKMFDRHANDVLGQPLSLLLPERFLHSHANHIHAVSRHGNTSRMMSPQLGIVGRRADGSEFPIESTISVTSVRGIQQMTAVLRDVSEHRRAEAELRAMNTQLRDLSASLQDVREQERARIARELHDELGQQLTGLKLDLSWLRSRLREGRPADPEKVDEMKKALDEALSSVRRISTDLRPPILDEQGFGDAVRWQAQELARRSGLSLHVDMPAVAWVQDNHLATALFRITQEAMSNTVRYAQAHQVWIELRMVDDDLVLTVRDDGVGFQSEGRQGGIGLTSMRERAVSLGGQFQAGNDPRGGAVVCVTLPLSLPVFEETLA